MTIDSTTLTGPPITRPVPGVLSKSMAHATKCPRFFAMGVLTSKLRMQSQPSEVGLAFHRYRALYIDHLVHTGRRSDPAWAESLIANGGFDEEAVPLILSDIERFDIDPATVFATELYLSVDEDFKPLEWSQEETPWRREQNPKRFAHGIIDLLSISGEQAAVDDYKTGYGYADDYEAEHVSALVFAHLEHVNVITFGWDYVRSRGRKSVTFTRSDFERLKTRVRSTWQQMVSLADRAITDGIDSLPVNPLAGLCGICEYTCPLRGAIKDEKVAFPPLQSAEDALLLTHYWVAAKAVASRAERALKDYLKTVEDGVLDIGETHRLALEWASRNEYPLEDTLAAIGYRVEDSGNPFDVRADQLRISASGLHQLAKAKKRAGMRTVLDKVAVVKPQQELNLIDLQKKKD